MQGTTLVIGILGSVLVILLRPPYALGVYIGVLLWYPDYLRVSIGTIDISAGRIVVTALLLRCLCSDQIQKKFIWSRLDTLVALSMVVYVGVYCLTYPSLVMALENRSGFLMDTWFAYMSARLIMTDKAKLIGFVKAVSFVVAALAILGVMESNMHWRPFAPLKRFRPWRTPVEVIGTDSGIGRWGRGRAMGPFSHPIMFGSSFVMFLPLIWALRHQRNHWGKLSYPLVGMAGYGVFSTMSSGPWAAGIVAVFCLAIERFKRWVKPLLIAFVILCIVTEIFSKRPFYYAMYSRANLGGGDWYQRVKLIDSARADFGQWWLAGYGGKDPGWGARYAAPTDTNNEFIKAGMEYGLLGIIALCVVLIEVFRGLSSASRKTADTELKSVYWSLGSTVLSVIVIWQGVSFFGTPLSLFYSILGMTASSLAFVEYVTTNNGTLLRTDNAGLIAEPERPGHVCHDAVR